MSFTKRHIRTKKRTLKKRQRKQRKQKGGRIEVIDNDKRLSESDIDEILVNSGFYTTGPNGGDISYIKAQLRRLRYDKWINCFTRKIDKNFIDQAIAKVKCWMRDGDEIKG
jgi:hypothetical protein